MRNKMIHPVSDFKNNFEELSKTVHETVQPIFLTEIEIYDKLLVTEQQAKYETKKYSMNEVLTSLDNIIADK